MRKTALTIAGSDCSGGAGIQADLKTMMANGVYAMSVITAMTAQNTTGVAAVQESTPEFLRQQLDCVFTDIFPDAVKIGMVSSAELIRVISERLRSYAPKNIVLDPVMVSTSGSRLLRDDAVEVLKTELFPLATVITPNIPEAELLISSYISVRENDKPARKSGNAAENRQASLLKTGKIRSGKEMEAAAAIIGETYGCAVLLKGGHSVNDADDLLYQDGDFTWFTGERIDNPNTHGTGCTLSSAIAAGLAKGMDLPDAIWDAKAYITGALKAGLDLGHGSGPLDHGWMV
ncbi:MAG: bifunctional hydroxymethylpyrimidine kinase/phosphomethylpyrimidine kinase [Clostridiales bacterium]|nr:bifunctional hydroxymethylpyrimidine kinase/phosphomethylpyrimidine kinase [Clostridiales bacterium]